MKKYILFLMLVYSTFGTPIGDFAPIKVGSKWVYSYYWSMTSMGEFSKCDSGTIEISVLSKEIDGNDTLVVLDLKQKFRSTGTYSGAEWYDSITNIASIETVIISNDSIIKVSDYHCPVYPFWATKQIDSEKLKKGFDGHDTLYYLTTWRGDIYLQNFGLYTFNDFYHGISMQQTKVQLISYNGHEISLGAHNKRYIATSGNGQHSRTIKSLSLSHQKIGNSTFSLSGRMMAKGNINPIGVVITKIIEGQKVRGK